MDKIKILDDKLNFQIKQLEFEYKQKYDKMASQIRELERKNEKVLMKMNIANKRQ